MVRGIAAAALFGMLTGGVVQTAVGQAAKTPDKSPLVRIQALSLTPSEGENPP